MYVPVITYWRAPIRTILSNSQDRFRVHVQALQDPVKGDALYLVFFYQIEVSFDLLVQALSSGERQGGVVVNVLRARFQCRYTRTGFDDHLDVRIVVGGIGTNDVASASSSILHQIYRVL
jgi:hypothetical protein